MDAEKKKNKKNKKKNKQQQQQQQQNGKTAADSDSAAAEPAAAGSADGGGAAEKREQVAEVRNGDVDLDRHLPNGTETASLESEIKRLQRENDSLIKKEISSEETVKRLQYENDSYIQKKAALEDTIKQLRDANDMRAQQEETLEETIDQLKIDNGYLMDKEAGLLLKIEELHREKHIWLEKEVILEEQLKLLESEKDSLKQTEHATKETISRMNVDVTRLRMQVVELEESRNSLLKENQQLSESISGLRLQLQNFETSIASAGASERGKHDSGHEELNSEIEAAHALVEKLIAENGELIEKVNELYIELGRKNAAPNFSTTDGTDLMVANSVLHSTAVPMPESNENTSLSGYLSRSSEVEATTDIPLSSEAESGEIVQIPLHDNEVSDLEVQLIEDADDNEVPLTDAPLIGAPFRFISFVASYVSGADLVSRDGSK
ncbi:hypothetical protein Tsubulata_000107 [Turnera subulata]|uniref:Uncharacterized protein n=1 Tax=Turnera subulata TaxID=218843 RepID=A0A9Q0J9G0_9ROSI|nr:hypothetical protein Tsubulata_000107 [Turnera subulata]